jgi:hypothetical protein
MTNAAHNGFGCPFCRTEMADAVEEEAASEYDNEDRYDSDDDEDASRASDYDEDDDDLEGELEFIEGEIKQMKLDHVLRGFRWMFQPLNEDADEDNDDLEAEEDVISVAEEAEEDVISVAEEAEEEVISVAEEAEDSDEEDINHPFYSYP